MATITAKYPGTCYACGQRFPAGTVIDYDRERGTRHEECQPPAPFVAPEGSWWISAGSGYGGEPYHVGTVILTHRLEGDYETQASKEVYAVVLHAEQEYFRDDGMSFGVGDDRGYLYRACVRVATEEESAPFRQQEERMHARLTARRGLEALAQRIEREGVYVPSDTPFPQGERVFDTQNIHGSGAVLVIVPDGAWYLERHMMDGDDWSHNNVAGTYQGWYLADPAIGDQARALVAQLEA